MIELKEQITSLVKEKISASANFLVEVKVSPSRIIVLVDHPDGVRIEDCVDINRFLHRELENTDVFEKHELEVGSPGMEEPLLVMQQFQRRIGQQVGVLTFDGNKHLGKLLSASEEELEIDEEVTVRTGKKKELIIKRNKIPFNTIKETRVIFAFEKINR